VHTARDWLTKLHLVAAGLGVTTVPPFLARAMPPGVTLLRVDGSGPEIRRLLLARLPGPPNAAVTAVAKALAEAG
jgi:DNA-binding transcriptional LysR family regulator